MHVLLVEDHPDLAANLGDFLGSHGHSVDFAADGPSGLRLAQSQRFDAIVLDRLLPGLDGASVCRRLRSAGGQQIPLLMLTALDTVNDRVEGLRAGADDYLVKPCFLEELQVRIEKLLDRRAGERHGPTRIGLLTIDPATREVRVGDREVELANKEFELLRMLATEPTRVFTKDELLRDVWGYETAGRTRTLDSHASRLRRKLDPDRGAYVVNCWGVGYRLVAG